MSKKINKEEFIQNLHDDTPERNIKEYEVWASDECLFCLKHGEQVVARSVGTFCKEKTSYFKHKIIVRIAE